MLKYMKALFSGSMFLLFFAIAFLYVFFKQLYEIYYGSKNLVEHTGVVEKKLIERKLVGVPDEDSRFDSVDFFRIKLYGNPKIYSATGKIAYYDYAILVGDTVKAYTKPINSIFGNSISDGSRTWATHDTNHIYHLVAGKDQEVVINFAVHNKNLKKTIWIVGAFAVGFLTMYLFSRRREKRSWEEGLP